MSARHPSIRHRSRTIHVMLAAIGCALPTEASAWSARGVVRNTAGKPLAGVAIAVKDSSASLNTTTDDSGRFDIVRPTRVGGSARRDAFSIHADGDRIVIRHPGSGTIRLALRDPSGSLDWEGRAPLADGSASATLPARRNVSTGILLVTLDGEPIASRVLLQGPQGWRTAPPPVASRILAAFPTLQFRKAGYRDTAIAMGTESVTNLVVTLTDTGSAPPPDFVEDHRSECVLPSLPAVSALTNNAFLPDPFKMYDGTAITTKAQMKCRREEVLAMLEKYVMGEKPRKPEKVTGAISGNKMTVSVTDKGKTVSFQVTISKPSGTGPFPAIIGLDGGTLGSSFSGLGVATISFPEMTLASEGSGRGKGVFYDLYGSSASAGELMAWAWGVSRVIDALAATPAAGIDVKHLAITGCSRLGKGAFVVGAMDQRIALVIPQESGTGGLSAWRIVAATNGAQPISSAAGEQYWMRSDFGGNFSNAPGKLPFDNHIVAGLIAPRAFLFFDNSIDWLGPVPGYGTAIAAKEIYTAMGVPEAFTYSSVGGHDHCGLPQSQYHWVQSYVKKSLLGQAGEAAKIEGPYGFDKAKWINWTTPTLK